jgi:hypothetical protein
MAGKASAEDLQQMYASSVAIYKNKPYYINRVSMDKKAHARNLLTQREEIIPIDEESWTAPTQRLGFINIKGSVLFLSRIPIRRYKVGLTSENIVIRTPPVFFPDGGAVATRTVKELHCIELADCIMGKYPTLPQAYASLEGTRGAKAFDRQFAVTSEGQIIYKMGAVGYLSTNSPQGIEDIHFSEGKEHLRSLLGNQHESVMQTARA